MLAFALRVAFACSLALSTACAQQGEQLTIAVRSLLPFMAPAPQLPAAMHTAMNDDWNAAPAGLDQGSEAEPPTWLLALLEQRYRAAIDAGRLTIKQSQVPVLDNGQQVGERPGTALILHGSADEVATCNRELDTISQAVGRPIEVTAFYLPLPDGDLPATTWDQQTLVQALQRTPPIWTTRGRTRSGGALRLAQEGGIGHVRDLDVEVAEKAQIHDPKVDIAFTGARATLIVHALPGDDLLLTGSWLLSEPVALHEQSIGSGAGSIDLPEHRTTWATFAGRIASAGALVVAGRGGPVGPAGFVLVVSARYLAPPAGDPAPDLLVRPIGALLTGTVEGHPQLGWRRPGDDSEMFPCHEGEGLTGQSLVELFAKRPAATVDCQAGLLLLRGDPIECRRGDTLLQQLFANLRPAAWHCRADAAGLAPVELAQPMLCDRPAAAFIGRERAVLRDHEVEIAQKAQAANPVVGIARSGLWFGATATVNGGAGYHVNGRWSLWAYDEPRQRELAEKQPMTLQLVDYRATTLPWDATMPPNVEQSIGDGPAWTAGGAATRVSVRLIAP